MCSVPDNVEDETAGCIHFADEFTNRYGAIHPEFFPGTLEEAIKEACLKPAKEVSELLRYMRIVISKPAHIDPYSILVL